MTGVTPLWGGGGGEHRSPTPSFFLYTGPHRLHLPRAGTSYQTGRLCNRLKPGIIGLPSPLELLRPGGRATPQTRASRALGYRRGACMIGSSFVAFGSVLGQVPVRRPAWPSAQSLRMDQKQAPNAQGVHSDKPPSTQEVCWCAGDPRRGWGLLGGNPTWSVWAVWALGRTRPPTTQTRSAPKRVLRPTNARVLAAKSNAGMK